MTCMTIIGGFGEVNLIRAFTFSLSIFCQQLIVDFVKTKWSNVVARLHKRVEGLIESETLEEEYGGQ